MKEIVRLHIDRGGRRDRQTGEMEEERYGCILTIW